MKKQSMSKVFLICGIVLFAGVLSAKELLTFDNATFRIEGRKNKGIENTSLTPSAKNGTVLRWKSPTPSAIELALVSPASPKIPLFEKALFTLNAEFPKELRLRRIVFRMQDAKGEIFQFSNRISGNFSGKMKLEYTLSEGSAESSWGRNKNKKIDWPLSFYGLAIDTNRNTDPNGEIILKSLEYQVLGEHGEIFLVPYACAAKGVMRFPVRGHLGGDYLACLLQVRGFQQLAQSSLALMVKRHELRETDMGEVLRPQAQKAPQLGVYGTQRELVRQVFVFLLQFLEITFCQRVSAIAFGYGVDIQKTRLSHEEGFHLENIVSMMGYSLQRDMQSPFLKHVAIDAKAEIASQGNKIRGLP